MSRSTLQVFESYQHARVTFVQTVAELASQPRNVDLLLNAGVITLLSPLVADLVVSIQQSAALALGRLAQHNDAVAEQIATSGILRQLVSTLAETNSFYKRSACFIFRAVAKHSPHLAEAVVQSGALENLIICLQDFEPSVKEAACWVVSHISRHSKNLASQVVEAGMMKYIILCIQEPELNLKRIAVSTISDIVKHSLELAHVAVDSDILYILNREFEIKDLALRRQLCGCLSQLAKTHAENLVQLGVVQKLVVTLNDEDEILIKNACTCLRELAQHDGDVAKCLVDTNILPYLVSYISKTRSTTRQIGVMCLGYIASYSETLALQIVVHHGISILHNVLLDGSDEDLLATCVWAISQIGFHSEDLSRAVADLDCLTTIVQLYVQGEDRLRAQARDTLKKLIEKCDHSLALESLVLESPPEILTYVVSQLVKTLPQNPNARQSFAESGGLQRLQETRADTGSVLYESIQEVNKLYPQDLINYFSPDYTEVLIKKIEDYNPIPKSTT